MPSFLLLDSSSYLLLDSDGSRLILSGDEDTVLGGSNFDYWLDLQNKKYRQAIAAKEKKEQEIIEEKLRVQQLINVKRDLEREKLVQNKKQITALQREIESANRTLEYLGKQLLKAQKDLLIYDNLLAEVLLIDSDPFFFMGGANITIH